MRSLRFWEYLMDKHRKTASSRPFPDAVSQKKAPAGAFFKTECAKEVTTVTSFRSPSLSNLRAVATYISSHTRCENATGSSGRMPSTSSAWS